MPPLVVVSTLPLALTLALTLAPTLPLPLALTLPLAVGGVCLISRVLSGWDEFVSVGLVESGCAGAVEGEDDGVA